MFAITGRVLDRQVPGPRGSLSWTTTVGSAWLAEYTGHRISSPNPSPFTVGVCRSVD